MAKYYANITGAANITTDFNPYSSYTGNGNYLRIELNWDNLQTSSTRSNAAVFYGRTPWFSFEAYNEGWEYLNLGTTTYIGRYDYWSTQGFKDTFVVEINNGNVSLSMGGQTSGTTFSGSLYNGNIKFFPSTYGTNTRINFYEMKVYGSGNTLLYDFVPGFSRDRTKRGLIDQVSGNLYSGDATYMGFVELSTFETDVEEINSTYLGSTTPVTLTTEEGVSWTATTIPSWLTLSSTEGTNTTQLIVTIPFNSTYFPKTGSIVFTSSEGDTATIAVTQAKHPVLIPKNNIYREGNLIN